MGTNDPKELETLEYSLVDFLIDFNLLSYIDVLSNAVFVSIMCCVPLLLFAIWLNSTNALIVGQFIVITALLGVIMGDESHE